MLNTDSNCYLYKLKNTIDVSMQKTLTDRKKPPCASLPDNHKEVKINHYNINKYAIGTLLWLSWKESSV